jgi:hypothetical protein
MKTFREYLQDKREGLHEVVQTVGTGTVNDVAANILEELKKNNNHTFARIKSYIYDGILAKTPTVPSSQIPPGYENKYFEELPKIRVPNTTDVKESNGFVHFQPKTNRPNRQKIGSNDEAKLTYKKYFSLNTDLSKLKEILNHVFRTIPVLALELYKVAIKNNDFISFKLPDQLFKFLEHPDTIVVHYYNETSGPEIEQVVDRLFPDQFDRGLRVKSGFDINHTPHNYVGQNNEGGSHSEIIAWAVAGTIIKEKDRILQKYDANSFGQKLLEVLKNYGQMDQRTLYGEYLKAKSFIPQIVSKPSKPSEPSSMEIMDKLIAAFKIGQIDKARINQEVNKLVSQNPGTRRGAFVDYINPKLGSPVVA